MELCEAKSNIEAALFLEICNLQTKYNHVIDSDKLEDWPDLFVDDCLYKIQPRENFDRNLPVSTIICTSKGMLIDRVVAHRHANIFAEHVYRHVVGMPLIRNVEDGIITVATSYVVFRTLNDGESVTYNVGRYEDKIVRENGTLKFKERQVIFDTNQIATQMVTPI